MTNRTPQTSQALTELCHRLMGDLETRHHVSDEARTTWVLRLEHVSYRLLRGVLDVLKGEQVRISGDPLTVVLAGPAAAVLALGELILRLDTPETLAIAA